LNTKKYLPYFTYLNLILPELIKTKKGVTLLEKITLPKKKNIKIKNNKFKDLRSIEILTNNKTIHFKENHSSIGINMDTNLIYEILSKTFTNVKLTKIENEFDLNKLVKRKPKLVFSGIKYFKFKNKKVWLNEILDFYDINYINSPKSSYENEHNKSFAKIIMQKNNIKTADFFTAIPREYLNISSLPIKFPLFIKPLTAGDSIGIDKNSIVNNFNDFKKKVLEIKLNQNSVSIVEAYLSGKEYSVGILQDVINDNLIAMPIEIIVKKDLNGNSILDYDTKKNDLETVIAVKNPIVNKIISELAKKAFTLLKGRLFGRIDIKMDSLGIPHFIEANLMPGLQKGYFYRSCSINLKMSYAQMITKISQNALNYSH